jgi:hypothetical protein
MSGNDDRAKGGGIQTTTNRRVFFVVPVNMGAAVEPADLKAGFLVIGGTLTALALGISILIRRTPDFQSGSNRHKTGTG